MMVKITFFFDNKLTVGIILTESIIMCARLQVDRFCETPIVNSNLILSVLHFSKLYHFRYLLVGKGRLISQSTKQTRVTKI